MPRRTSSGARRRRKHAAEARERTLGLTGGNHSRIELDSTEFASIFVVEGGRGKIGPDVIVRAVDQYGRRPGQAVAPLILDLDRGKVAMIMARANDAAAIVREKEKLKEERQQFQVDRLERAHERNLLKWCRQEVPDQRLRSVLVGTAENGTSPNDGSDSLVICYRGDDSRYHVAEEKWTGLWSVPDRDGISERIDVTLDEAPVTFGDENEAHRVILTLIHGGELERFAHRRDATHFRRLARRLVAWERNGKDMKEIYKTPETEKTPERPPGSHWVRQE